MSPSANNINNVVKLLGHVDLPKFSGIRILMMPFIMDNLNTVPFSDDWKKTIGHLIKLSPVQGGTGYITIDEMPLEKGEYHRRPGLHVDGWHDEGNSGSWGGGGAWGGGKGGHGMVVISSHIGCRAWNKSYNGAPKMYGYCEHLRPQFPDDEALVLQPNIAYHMGGLTVHESIRVTERCQRQFVRLSMPSDADWNDSNTHNPLGIKPTGRVVPSRPISFAYR